MSKRSAASNRDNARRYRAGPLARRRGDALVNVSAIADEFGINYWTFLARQRNGWAVLDGGRLTAHPQQWGPRNQWENTYLHSQVEDAIKKDRAAKDLTGMGFGRGKVMGRDPKQTQRGHRRWRLLCDPQRGGCGKEYSATTKDLRKGHVRSCGCLRRDIRYGLMKEKASKLRRTEKLK